MHYSVVQLVGTGTVTDPFRPPTTEEFSIIDLRPLSAQEEGKVDGFALVATPVRVPRLGLYLGDDAKAVSPGMAKQLSNRLGLNLDADPTLGEIIGELLTRHATGENDKTRWNPVAGTKLVTPQGNRWRFDAYLGGEEPVWTREVLRADGGQQYTDNFNRSNAATPGSPWVVQVGGFPIVSQKLNVTGTGDNLAIYNVPLNSNDHWASFDLVSNDANFRGVDAQVRHGANAAAGTDVSCYGSGYIIAGGSYEIYKKSSAGNQTTLFSQSGSNPQTSTIRTDINGSTLKGTVSGTVRGTVTDTTITAGKYTGVFVYQGSSQINLDNFVASDYQATFAADGAITSSGVQRKTMRKSSGIAGTVAPSGAFSKIRAVTRFFVGTITPGAGVVKRAFLRVFTGTIASSAPGPKKLPRIGATLAGTVATSAKIKFTPIRRFAGSIGTAGNSILTNVGRVFGEAGLAKVWNEVAGEIRSWISKG